MAKELWRECAAWLSKLRLIPADSSCLGKNARVYDLALALQDGVVLCYLANTIVKNAIETIHGKLDSERPEKQFLKMQNINAFLDVCPKLGVKSDLFNADELYYASDFPKVITCLEKLSKSKAAKTRQIPAFNTGSAQNTARDESGEDMYQSLEDLVGQSISFEEAAASSAAYDPEDQEEDPVYGSIMNVIGDRSEDIYSDLMYARRGGRAGADPGVGADEDIYTTGGPQDRRGMVLNECQETERNYVEVLKVIIEKFMRPLESSGKINRGDCKLIFSNVTDLLQVHVAFLKDIDEALSSTTGRNVSLPFLNHLPKMRVYGQFCCDVPKAMEKLKVLEKSGAGKLIESARQASGQRFHLKDLLNVPMQRVLKYPLLLKELVKHTPDDHKDKHRLVQAKAALDDLAIHINSTKKDYDCLMDMIASLQGYSGGPLQQYAPFVKDGDLMYKDTSSSKKDEKKMNLRYVFMLQSAVIFTQAKKTKFAFKSLLELTKEMTVAEMPFWTLPKEEQNGKYSFAWSIKLGDEPVHVFAAKTLPTKKKWMTLLNNSLDMLRAESEPTPQAPGRKQASSRSAPPAGAPKPKVPRGPAVTPAGGRQSYEKWEPIARGPPTPVSPSVDAGNASNMMDENLWYAGRMPRLKAEKLFSETKDGTFLVRESDSRPGEYSLSVKYNIVKHIKINRHGKMYELAPDAKAFESIQELVEHFRTHSLNRHFPGMETTLDHPFKDQVSAKGNMYGQKPAAGIGRARSRFAYAARSHDELSFERGVELIIHAKKDPILDPGWWKGALPNGQIGIFPANYVQDL